MDSVDLGIAGLSDFRVVGSGGFATVYSARDEGFDRTVAVKVMHSLDEDGRRRFDRERRIMGRLAAHPNVITPFQAGYTSSRAPYLVMEFVDGGSLDDRLRRRGPFPWTEAVDHVLAATSALAHAHGHGVLHRDVKPANIMLADGTAKLTDFGIAAIRGIPVSQVAYTLAHSPPETFAHGSDTRDERSDLYSMASTLYALIAGRAPFEAEGEDSQQAYMFRILDGSYPALTEAEAPFPVRSFLEHALAADPDARPQTADGFGRALEEIQFGGAGVGASAEGPGPVVGVAPADVGPGDAGLRPQTLVAPDTDEPRSDSPSTEPPLTELPPNVPPSTGPSSEPTSSEPPTPGRQPSQVSDPTDMAPPPPSAAVGRRRRVSMVVAGLAGATVVAVGAQQLLTDPEPESAAASSTTLAATAADDAASAPLPATSLGSDGAELFAEHGYAARFVNALPDGRVASIGYDRGLIVWNPDTLDIERTIVMADTAESMVVLADGRIGVVLVNGGVQVLDPDDERPPIEFAGHTTTDPTLSAIGLTVAALPDGRLATGGVDGLVLIWDPSAPEAEPVRFEGHLTEAEGVTVHVWSIEALSDGRIASADGIGNGLVWDPTDPSAEPIRFGRGQSAVTGIEELADRRLVVSASTGTVLVWDLDSTVPIRFGGHEGWVQDVHRLESGLVASVEGSGPVLVWDPDDPEGAVVAFTGHVPSAEDAAEGGAFATAVDQLPDGRIVSAGVGGVQIWTPET